MALQTITLDPNAVAITDDEHVDAINAASNQITRASSVASVARPIEAGEITVSELASNASRNNLDAMADVDRKYVRTLPVSGEFKIINMQRNAAGTVDVEFDDVVVP